eukprot:gene18156-24723_t
MPCGRVKLQHQRGRNRESSESDTRNSEHRDSDSASFVEMGLRKALTVHRTSGGSHWEVGMRFSGTASYIASDDLAVAVNAAVRLERPLLVKGEPGTGKTVLAREIASALGAPLIEWHVKSTTKAQQGLYEYDAVARLRDSQLGEPRVGDIARYI